MWHLISVFVQVSDFNFSILWWTEKLVAKKHQYAIEATRYTQNWITSKPTYVKSCKYLPQYLNTWPQTSIYTLNNVTSFCRYGNVAPSIRVTGRTGCTQFIKHTVCARRHAYTHTYNSYETTWHITQKNSMTKVCGFAPWNYVSLFDWNASMCIWEQRTLISYILFQKSWFYRQHKQIFRNLVILI